MDDLTIDHLVARIAERHHGVFALHHLDELEITQKARLHRVQHGRWVSPYDGVYRVAGSPHTWKGDVIAATWAGGEHAVASHRSAAALWALPGGRATPVEITCPRWRRTRHAGLVVHESTRLDGSEITVVENVRCTTVERTIFDLCALFASTTIDLAIDSALRRGLTSLAALHETHDRLATRGRRGGRRFRAALESRADAAPHESAPERLVARALVRAGLGKPSPQHVVTTRDGRFIARVDLAYPGRRIAIEYDSYQEHTGKVALVRDSARRNALAAAGWTVLSATAEDLRHGCRRLVSDLCQVLRDVASSESP
jgi:very-short-patch-repair endonuclease